ncbi:M13 family metallopeptidase [Parasphingorhabdus litoris]|uniref:M13 family metallopeptidase n=1 Tax=Parasphingorhabdus litoris TaxID=394733 RepID=A0ABN1A343_9SPHN|nr:M13 family metallopeptidase [Parasphingorhabdus litoris]
MKIFPALFLSSALIALPQSHIALASSSSNGVERVSSEKDHPKTSFGAWGIGLDNIDHSTKAGDDFFRHMNGRWLDKTEPPAGRARWSAFNALAADTNAFTQSIIDDAISASAPDNTPLQRIGDLYRAFTDRTSIDNKGLTPIQTDLDAIQSATSHEDIARWMADPRAHSISSVIAWLNPENPSQHIIYLDQISFSQGMLGLPTKTHYISEDAPYPANRAAYVDHIENMFKIAGFEQARNRAEAVMALETDLAERSWDQEKLRQRTANINVMPRSELESFAPGFPWTVFLTARGVNDTPTINLGTDTAIQASAKLFRQIPVETWRDYLSYHWIKTHKDLLPTAVTEEWFSFYATTLRGVKSPSPLEKRAVRYANRQLGQQIGQIYAERHFPESYRAQMEELVGYLRSAFVDKLGEASWMDEPTRREALAKISKMELAVGYPGKWNDRVGLVIRADDPVGNYKRILDQNWQQERALLGGPYPAGKWWMNAQTVDASFSPQLNRITFPAGILQPPFFNPDADPAVNFGAIGAIIGHEMGHGFDDQGSGFDAKGQARDWWSENTRAEYAKRVKALSDQYSAFEPLPDTPINGAQTVGENMGDLIGVSIALRAYEIFAKKQALSLDEKRDGYTGYQRFFMGWAQAHRAVYSEKGLREELVRSFHSPHPYRVNGVVRNMDSWYKAFNVGPEHKLYLAPKNRIRFW